MYNGHCIAVYSAYSFSLIASPPQCIDLLSSKDLKKVRNAVYGARAKWRSLGTELGLSEDDLDSIERDEASVEDRLSRMLTMWLRRLSLCPTWENLVKALRSKWVQREDVAKDVIGELQSEG